MKEYVNQHDVQDYLGCGKNQAGLIIRLMGLAGYPLLHIGRARVVRWDDFLAYMDMLAEQKGRRNVHNE